MVFSVGIDISDAVGLITSSGLVLRFNRLGLGARRLATGEVGVDKLRALPKRSLAADATVQFPPPLVALKTVPLPLLATPGCDNTPGPPSPAAAPVRRVETSDAIVSIPFAGREIPR
jgi:hypothetical protein